MSELVVEIIDRFDESIPCRELVHSTVPDGCRVRRTRVYELSSPDPVPSLESFVRDVLVDDVSQDCYFLDDIHDGVRSEFDHRIDVWFKPEVLDLEEDYLLDYCEKYNESIAVRISSLRILDRYYLTLPEADDETVRRIVEDLANPVIHDWSVTPHA